MHVAVGPAPRRIPLAAAVFDMSRGRQALLSIAQPVLCVLIALGRLPGVRVAVLGTIAALAGELAVYSLNDVLDYRADAESLKAGKGDVQGFDIDTAFERHPIAHGHVSLSLGIAWVTFLCAVFSVSAWLLSPLCLLFFGVAVGLQVVYCLLRRVTWTKTIISGVMVGIGSLAGWVAVAPLSARALWPFLFLAAWETDRNLTNDLADIESDSRVGLATVAHLFGPRTSARAVFGVMVATVVFAGLLPMPWPARALAVAGAVWSMIWPAWRLLRRPTPALAAAHFNHVSVYPVIVVVALLLTWAIQGIA
jgi:4-hydroxybenzoate polyprenyltransferase